MAHPQVLQVRRSCSTCHHFSGRVPCRACAAKESRLGHYGQGDDEEAEDFAAGSGADENLEDGGDRETEV